jgi:glycosyltransferase involved in cell wall biosynthesis
MTNIAYFFSTSVTAHVFFREHFLSLQKENYEILVVTGEDEFYSDLKIFCEEKNIKLMSFKARRGYGLNCIPEFLSVCRIANRLKKQRYYFVTNTPKISFYVALFSVFRNKKNIVHYNHGLVCYPADELSKKIILCIEAFICSQSSAVIFVSSSIRNWASSNFPKILRYPKFHHLNSIRGVKIPKARINDEDNNRVVLGYIGRISKDKGFKEFFDIVIQLNSEGINIGCVIAGVIEDENLRPFVDYLDRLWFADYLGHIEDVNSFFSKIDLLVFPSKREGFGMVALESSAAGVPVVAYNIHGVKDAVLDNQTGKLVEPYDSKKFYDQIKLLCNNRSLIRKLGNRAHLNAKNNFDSEHIVSKHIKLINSIFKI